MIKEQIIREITKSVTTSAANVRMDAGYSGRMDDGGASQMEERLKYWLDGVNFSGTGVTSVYASILKRVEEESDPEYLEFKRLQEKFGK